MLIDSVLRAGRFDQAKALLADRLQHQPRTARATAERLIAA
jgi:hypothetical protein